MSMSTVIELIITEIDSTHAHHENASRAVERYAAEHAAALDLVKIYEDELSELRAALALLEAAGA